MCKLCELGLLFLVALGFMTFSSAGYCCHAPNGLTMPPSPSACEIGIGTVLQAKQYQ